MSEDKRKPPELMYVLFNSSGCDLGALEPRDLISRIRNGELEDGDSIKVVRPAEYPDGSNYYPEDEDRGQGLDLERTRDLFAEGS